MQGVAKERNFHFSLDYIVHSTSNELLSLEKAVSAWAEWEGALRELQGALRGDMATLQSLRDRGGDQPDVAKQIRQLAASLVDKKKVFFLFLR